MELAGIILIGIGVNTFVNGVWLLLFNSTNKRIDNIETTLKEIKNLIN